MKKNVKKLLDEINARKAKIKNLDCAIIVPERSHYKETVEIVCHFHLRRTLGLENGDKVEVRVDL